MRTHCCRHIVAHDVTWAAQTGKHLLRTQNVSEQNQKHFLCPGHKIVSATNVARAGKQGNSCVSNNVSSFARALKFHFRKLCHMYTDAIYVSLSNKSCKFISHCQDLSNVYLKAVNSY